MLISRTPVPGTRLVGAPPHDWDVAGLATRLNSRRYWIKRRYLDDIRRLRALLLESGALTLFLEGGSPIERGAIARAILSRYGDQDGGEVNWFAAPEDGTVELPSDEGVGAWVIDRANSLSDESISQLALSLHRKPRTLLLLSDYAEERLTELGTVNATKSAVLRLVPMDRSQAGEFLEHMLSGAVATSTLEALWSWSGGQVLRLYALVSEHLQRGSLLRVEGAWMIEDWGRAATAAAELTTLLDAESTLSASALDVLTKLSAEPRLEERLGVFSGLAGPAASALELERAGIVRVAPGPVRMGSDVAMSLNFTADLAEGRQSATPALSRKALMAEFAATYALIEQALDSEDHAAANNHLVQLRAIQASLKSQIVGDMLESLHPRLPDSAELTWEASLADVQPEDWTERAWLPVIEGKWGLLHQTLDEVFSEGGHIAPESAALIELLLGLEAFMQGKAGAARSHIIACIQVLPDPTDITFARAAFALSAVLDAQAGRKKKAVAEIRRFELIPPSPHALVEGLVSLLAARAHFILGNRAHEKELDAGHGETTDQQVPSLRVLALFLGSAPTSEDEFERVLAVTGRCETPLAQALTAAITAMRNPTLEHVQRAIDVCSTYRVRSLEKRMRHMLAKLSPPGGHRRGNTTTSHSRSVLHERSQPEGLRSLTARESEVLDLLREGASNREISDHLNVSVRTAESHVGRVLHKLGLNRRHEVSHLKTSHGMLLPTVHTNPDPVGGL